jgi:hypothetical protein
VEEVFLHLLGHFTGFTTKAQGTFHLQAVSAGSVGSS